MKNLLLLILVAYAFSFNIIQRIAKFRDEHLRFLIQKDEANENENLIEPDDPEPDKKIEANTTTVNNPTPAPVNIPQKPPVYHRGRRGRRHRRKKRDL